LDGVRLQKATDNLARTLHIALNNDRQPLLFLADEEVPPTLQSGEEFGGDNVVCFGQGSDHFQRTFGPSSWAAMSLPPDCFDKTVGLIAERNVESSSISLWLKPSRSRLRRLRRLHQEVTQMARSGGTTFDHPEVARSLAQSLTIAMAACFSERNGETRGLGWHRHQQIMRRFKEWIEANIERPIYLSELCKALNVSARTLTRCCEEYLGMSPMKYLWLRRMNQARVALQNDNSPASVTEIAMNFGFWHFGRFANEYLCLFGEAPRTTLARRVSPRDQPQSDSANSALGEVEHGFELD
jgi:AraC-like DNA-binding protein